MSVASKLRTNLRCGIGALLLLHASGYCQPASPLPGLERVYIGTYTSSGSLGIYQANLDLGKETFATTSIAGKTGDPSFIALHPSGNFLYAVNESAGAVVAFAVDRVSGALTSLNQQDSLGAGPCHVVVDRAGKNVLVANYTGGSVTVFPVQSDGRLGAATAHIQHPGPNPHAHCIALDAANNFALVCDLGLDRIFSYRFDPNQGTLTTNSVLPWTSVPTGAGPRHLAFEPQYRRAYVICELNSTIIGFNYDSLRGTLSSFQTNSSIPGDWNGINAAAEIAVHPSGRFLYASNRGYNSIAVFAVDPVTGLLTLIQQQSVGQTPRHFALDPSGTLCLAADQDSNDVRLYAIDGQTGRLTSTGQALAISKPVCVLPLLIRAPQPVLALEGAQVGELQINIGNTLGSLTYRVDQATPAPLGIGWTPLATGSPGQTNFLLTNSGPQGFFRAFVVTNY